MFGRYRAVRMVTAGRDLTSFWMNQQRWSPYGPSQLQCQSIPCGCGRISETRRGRRSMVSKTLTAPAFLNLSACSAGSGWVPTKPSVRQPAVAAGRAGDVPDAAGLRAKGPAGRLAIGVPGHAALPGRARRRASGLRPRRADGAPGVRCCCVGTLLSLRRVPCWCSIPSREDRSMTGVDRVVLPPR